MSEQHPEVHVERDRINNRVVAIIVIVSLAIMLLSIWIAWILLVEWEQELPRARRGPLPPRRAPAAIATVNQTELDEDHAGIFRRRQRSTLETYEWVDRDRGVVKIPIERAMELRARGVMP